jgi:hypothetical protein
MIEKPNIKIRKKIKERVCALVQVELAFEVLWKKFFSFAGNDQGFAVVQESPASLDSSRTIKKSVRTIGNCILRVRLPAGD